MFIVYKLFQIISPLSLALVLEIIFFSKTPLAVLLPVTLLITASAVWLYHRFKFTAEFFSFLISPLVFVAVTILFALFIDKTWLYHLYAGFVAIFLFVYLGRMLDYKFYPTRYQPYSLENFSWYMAMLSTFLFFSFAFGLIIFLKMKLLFLALIVLAFSLLLLYQIFWINKIQFADSHVFIVAIAVVLVELFAAIYYLPTGFYVNAFILTVAFYLMTGLARAFLSGSLDKKKIINFLAISAVCLVAILATARWI
ncbi:MAG: hypothetical protein ACOZBH_01935 [Patescibacteria group bacterium]